MSTEISESIATTRPPRLTSLDALRGMTIAGMILVNNPGSWKDIYPPLKHASWDGMTPTDLVFPTFLFIMGVSIAIALTNRLSRGSSTLAIIAKVIWRSIVIFGLGLALNGFPNYILETLRIPGVLQRIAICYLFGSLIFISTGPKVQIALIPILLAAYTAIMRFVEVPGFPLGDLSRAGNVAAHFDRILLAGHIYKPEYDPEGILSTMPALVTTLIGMWAGRRLSSGLRGSQEVGGLVFVGIISLAMGYAWGTQIPINKALWSGPFVLVAAGYAMLALGVAHRLIDLNGKRQWVTPFVIFGVNPIAAYVLSGLVSRLMGMELISRGESKIAPKPFLYETLFTPYLHSIDASLAWAISYVFFWLVIMAILYRFKIIIKV